MDDDRRRLLIMLVALAVGMGVACCVCFARLCLSCPVVCHGKRAVPIVVRQPPPVVSLRLGESGAVPEKEPAEESGAHRIRGLQVLPVATPVACAPVHISMGREVLHAPVPETLAHNATIPVAPVGKYGD